MKPTWARKTELPRKQNPRLAFVLAVGLALGTAMMAAQEPAPDPPANPPVGPLPADSPVARILAEVPDFSWAGYRAGEADPPILAPTHTVTDFGAVADDEGDDTDAIARAIAAASAAGGGVVRVPAGVWRITRELDITANGVVLQGEGAGQTIFDLRQSLSDIHGYAAKWSWSGGFVQFHPANGRSETVATVTQTTLAGGSKLRVKLAGNADIPAVGERLELAWFNDKGHDTLLDHLYGGVIPRNQMGRELQDADGARVREWVKIVAIEVAENAPENNPEREFELTIEQPLRIDARPEWRPQLARKPILTEAGIEGITFRFVETRYPGHLKERGFNAISMSSAINCWVRDIETVFADSGVFLGSCRYCTVDGFLARGRTMHHPLCASWCADCLITNWRIDAPHIHGTTISWAAHGNVFSHGFGRGLAMDSHRAASFQNLHTAITIDHGNGVVNPFRSGGSAPRGPHAAKQNVYWNVKNLFSGGDGAAARIGPVREWPLGIFVGWHGTRPLTFEPIANLKQQVVALGEVPAIPDLHAYQRRQRLGR